MARETVPWDAAETLRSGEDIAAYLDAVLEDGDLELLKAAIGDIARTKGMTGIARVTGLGRAGLYKALSPEGNPEFVNRYQGAQSSWASAFRFGRMSRGASAGTARPTLVPVLFVRAGRSLSA